MIFFTVAHCSPSTLPRITSKKFCLRLSICFFNSFSLVVERICAADWLLCFDWNYWSEIGHTLGSVGLIFSPILTDRTFVRGFWSSFPLGNAYIRKIQPAFKRSLGLPDGHSLVLRDQWNGLHPRNPIRLSQQTIFRKKKTNVLSNLPKRHQPKSSLNA